MIKQGNNIMRKLRSILLMLKGECIVITVKKDTLVVDAGNKSAEDVKDIASTFFRTAYKLS